MTDKLRVAILGCGGIARHHALTYHAHPNAELVALCDVSEERVAAFVDRIEEKAPGIAKDAGRFTDAGKMYGEAAPEAVSICTPHTLHYRQCLEALDAGCHVLVEKPMVTSCADAVALEKRVQAGDRQLQIAYITPSRAECGRLREICRTEEYGALKVVNCTIGQHWYQGTRGAWRQDPALSGGGMIYDSGAHVLNTLVWTVEQDIEEVHAYVDNRDTQVDINGTVNIRFRNGVIASVAVCGEAPASSSGAWYFEQATVQLDPWIGTGLAIRARRNGETKDDDPRVTAEDSNPMHNFIEAILGRAEPVTTPRNGVILSRLMDAIYESARTGAPARPTSSGRQ